MGKVEEMAEEKVEVGHYECNNPSCGWVSSDESRPLSRGTKVGCPTCRGDARFTHMTTVTATPNTRQRAARAAARRIYDEIDGVPDVPELADIIAAEFEK